MASVKKAAPKAAPSKKTVASGKSGKSGKSATLAVAPKKAPASKAAAKPLSKAAAPAQKTSLKTAAPAASKAAAKTATKATAKPVAKKAVVKKAAPEKVAAKKVLAKKAPAKKTAPEKVVVKKAVAKKVPAKPQVKAASSTKASHQVSAVANKAAVKQAAPKKPATAPAKVPAPTKAVTLTPPSPPAAKKTKAKPAGGGKSIVPSSTFENPPKIEMTTRSTLAAPTPAAIKKNPKLASNWKTKPVAQLSDEEIIAMPDSEYMNEVQLAFFRLRLVALKNNILANAGETTVNLKEDSSIVPDPADRATIEEEHALELRTRDRERKLLKKIEQSIARIDNDDYGYCDETGEPIGVPRLLARPTATLSLEAQTRRELKQKMFGD